MADARATPAPRPRHARATCQRLLQIVRWEGGGAHMRRFFWPARKKLLAEKKIIGRKKDGLGQFDEIPLGRWPARPWPGQARHQY